MTVYDAALCEGSTDGSRVNISEIVCFLFLLVFLLSPRCVLLLCNGDHLIAAQVGKKFGKANHVIALVCCYRLAVHLIIQAKLR